MAGTKQSPVTRRDADAIDPWRVVAEFAPFLNIAHQISGRVRLKLDTAAFDVPAIRGIGSERLKAALGGVRGVHDISLNLLARSCVVAYDSEVIPDPAWPDLLAGRQTAAATTLIGILREKYEEVRNGQL